MGTRSGSLGMLSGWDPPRHLAGHLQRLPAGGQHRNPGAAPEHLVRPARPRARSGARSCRARAGARRSPSRSASAVVASSPTSDFTPTALEIAGRDARGIPHLRQLDPPDAVHEAVEHLGGRQLSQTGSCPPLRRPRSSPVGASRARRGDRGDLVGPPDERRQLDGQVVPVHVERSQGLERRRAGPNHRAGTRARGERDPAVGTHPGPARSPRSPRWSMVRSRAGADTSTWPPWATTRSRAVRMMAWPA